MSALRDVLTELEDICADIHHDSQDRVSSACAVCDRLDELFTRARAELDALEAPQPASTPTGEARGVAGDYCESGNECGRVGCPECQQ